MKLLLLPLMGPFHLRYPQYNAVSVRDAVAAFEPEAVVTTAVKPESFDDPRWQDTPETPLPHTVVPWAKRQDVPVYPVFEPTPDPNALNDFRRYAGQYPQLRGRLQQADALLRPLQVLLEEGLTLPRILEEVVPILREQQTFLEAVFEEGPATDWLRTRATTMAERVLALPHERVAVLASIDHLPFLQEALAGKAELVEATSPQATPESRERSLLDFAFRVDVPEPGNVLAQLRDLDSAEARYHEANLLTANAHVAEALEVLEGASRGDFSEPYYLPGYLLARLGQLYDLAGNRDAALRSYRGVRALEYAPQEAVQVAAAGLEEPFAGLSEGEAEVEGR